MPDPTQHSLPEVPKEAPRAAWRVLPDGVSHREAADAIAATLPSLHAAWEKGRAEQFGPEAESWVNPDDGETYTSLNQRERAMLDSACINQQRREEVEASPGVLSKEEAQKFWAAYKRLTGTHGAGNAEFLVGEIAEAIKDLGEIAPRLAAFAEEGSPMGRVSANLRRCRKCGRIRRLDALERRGRHYYCCIDAVDCAEARGLSDWAEERTD